MKRKREEKKENSPRNKKQKTSEKEQTEEEEEEKCSKCLRVFREEEEYYEDEDGNDICSRCDDHPDVKLITPAGKFECGYCHRKFSDKNVLKECKFADLGGECGGEGFLFCRMCRTGCEKCDYTECKKGDHHRDGFPCPETRNICSICIENL